MLSGLPAPWRGVSDIYDTLANDNLGTTIPTRANGRGNVLNPAYACEAYRYAMADALTGNDAPPPRHGLTPYVEQERLDLIRSPVHGTLPRFLNWRLLMENTTSVTPPLSPNVRSMAIVYRMKPR